MTSDQFLADNFSEIDRLAVRQVPGYAQLSFDERLFAIKYIMEYQLPYYYPPEMLGAGGTITTIVIAIVGVLVALAAVIIPLAVDSSKSKDASRVQATADVLNQQAATVEASATTIETENKQKETTAKIALGTVLGFGVVAAFLTFT